MLAGAAASDRGRACGHIREVRRREVRLVCCRFLVGTKRRVVANATAKIVSPGDSNFFVHVDWIFRLVSVLSWPKQGIFRRVARARSDVRTSSTSPHHESVTATLERRRAIVPATGTPEDADRRGSHMGRRSALGQAIPFREITPEQVYGRRRDFLRGSAALALGGATLLGRAGAAQRVRRKAADPAGQRQTQHLQAGRGQDARSRT